jgi:inosine-uridine nucleoside N-ribohydrolase
MIGISTSLGNSSVDSTTKNCLKVLKGINKLDIPVI